jgi:hypothetical protein
MLSQTADSKKARVIFKCMIAADYVDVVWRCRQRRVRTFPN